MSVLDSLRVLSAMARVTAPTLVELARGQLSRAAIDDRTHWFGRRVVELLGVELVVTGTERVPPGRAYVYMSNHQSHMDVPMLYAALPSPTLRMVAKSELFKVPVWGRAVRAAEFVEVDRSNHARAVASIEVAAQLVREGVSIWLAPEGTRSKDGSIHPLKKGGFHLAIDTGTPIVPVAIRGTLEILPPGAASMATGRRVEITIGAPIDVAGRELASLSDEVRAFLVANGGRAQR